MRATIDLAGATVELSSNLTHVDLFSRGKCKQIREISFNYAFYG